MILGSGLDSSGSQQTPVAGSENGNGTAGSIEDEEFYHSVPMQISITEELRRRRHHCCHTKWSSMQHVYKRIYYYVEVGGSYVKGKLIVKL
jgi:hypothetical protein